MTRWLVPPLRRTVQTLSVLVLVALPLVALYSHYRSAHALEDLPEAEWRSSVMRAIDRVVGDDEKRLQWVQQTQGTFWSARLGGVELTDPLAGMETLSSSRTFSHKALLWWSLLIPVIGSLVLGRVFCGWICPMNTLLEIVDRSRRLLRLAELKERDVRFAKSNKYLILVGCLAVVAILRRPFLALVYPPAVISREVHLWVFDQAIGIGVYLILGICLFELFVSRRWWCRYVCPGGAVYSMLGRFRLLRVRRDARACIECGDCVRVCQFDLRPMTVQLTGMECTNCASCISSCRSGALNYSFVLPVSRGRGTESSGEDENRSDQGDTGRPTKPGSHQQKAMTVIAVLAAITWLGAASPAAAHHILGLPHYSYKENYPQAPTLEYPATAGPYDILLTSYPGKPVPGEAAAVAFYIKNRNTGEPYDQPITVRVLQTSTFGSNKTIYPLATHPPFDNQFKYTVNFPEDGEYVVEMTMDVDGKDEVISFLMVAGNPTPTASILIATGVALGVFLIVVRAIKIKRRRGRAAREVSREETPTGAPVCGAPAHDS